MPYVKSNIEAIAYRRPEVKPLFRHDYLGALSRSSIPTGLSIINPHKARALT